MEEKKKSITKPIITIIVGLCLVGAVASVQSTSLLPNAFAQQVSPPTNSMLPTGPSIPKVVPQVQTGIPLGPPYGSNWSTLQGEIYALAAGLGALAVCVWIAISLLKRKMHTIIKMR